MRRLRLAAIVVATVLTMLAPGAPVTAQDRDGDLSARLVVTSLSGVLGPVTDRNPDDDVPADEDLHLRLLVENDGDEELSDLRVIVEIHEQVRARSVLEAALDQQDLSTFARDVTPADVRSGGVLGPGELAGVQIDVPGPEAGWIGQDGVFPVQISVFRGTQELDRVVTAVVHLTQTPERPLLTEIVWPITGPTQRMPDGTYPDALPDEYRRGGHLDTLLRALEQHAGAPVRIAPDMALVEELADRSDGFLLIDGTEVTEDAGPARTAAELLERIRALVDAAPEPPVAGPYANADVAALVSGPEGVDDLAGTAITIERARMEQLLGRAADPSTYLATTPVTPLLVETLPADRILLPSDQIASDPAIEDAPGVAPARRGLRGTGGRWLAALVADPAVTAILDDPPASHGEPVLRQRIVAETALLHQVAPGLANRGLLVLPPADWTPAKGALAPLLDGLLGQPWLRLESPPAPSRESPAARLAAGASALPAAVATELAGVRRLIMALGEAVTADDDADEQRLQRFEDALLRATTPERLRDGGRGAVERLAELRSLVEDAFGAVRISEGSRVTLTSETGTVPITLERTEGGPIDVVVEVESAGRLLWEERLQAVSLPNGGARTVSFTTRAVSRGTFPVTVTVWDPTGTRLMDTATLSVRSTAISGPALVVIGVVVLGLLAAGARRRRRPRLEIVE